MNIGIFGFGEVGRAIHRLCNVKVAYVEDPKLQSEEPPDKLDFLHICIPYSKDFMEHSMDIIARYPSATTIIHSTVPIGTTKTIADVYPRVVHVPIRGTHPNLAEHMKDFITYVGFNISDVGTRMKTYLEAFFGLKCELVYDTDNTEAGKLLDTLYYGICIEYHRFIKKVCDKFNLDFQIVGTRFNETYNQGYKNIKPNVIRPVLFPPEGKIGGHCILPNAELLAKQIDSWLLDGILEENK